MTWRWPWIARIAYDDLKAQLHDERERTRRLTDLILDFKVAGGSVPASSVHGTPSKLDRITKSAIQQAIDENRHAQNNPRLRSHLASWADNELAKDPNAEARVLASLRSWDIINHDDDEEEDDDVVDLGGVADVESGMAVTG